jgi:glycosyltransferase involved in cell wall biosynthesis
MPQTIVHVITPDTPRLRLAALHAVMDSVQDGMRHHVLRVGAGALDRAAPRTGSRIAAGFDLPWLAAYRTKRCIDKLAAAIVHCWSPSGLKWLAPATSADTPLLIEADVNHRPRTVAKWFTAVAPERQVSFLCPSGHARRRLVECGVPIERVATLRPFTDFAALNQADRRAVRESLRLDPEHKVVLALPPVNRKSGHFMTVWSVFIVHVIRRDVRVVIPGQSEEVERLRRLVRQTRHEPIARFCGDTHSLPELLAVADVVSFLPPHDQISGSLAWAMASGKPILASAIPAMTELLADRHNAWLTRVEPHPAARKLLMAIESPKSAELARVARSQAYEVFSRRRMIEQYSRVYANILAGRDFADGLVDAAVVA